MDDTSELEAAVAEAQSLARKLERLRRGFENARSGARRELTDELNQAVRRLKNAESRDVWIHTLLDATSEFCGKAAVFLLTPGGLRFEGARGVAPLSNGTTTEISLSSSPAFAGAIESRDTVISIGTARELSSSVAALLGDASDRRVYLFPL